MLANLILVFCLSASPTSCHEERPELKPMPMMACLVEGQRYAQDWLADHPKWSLSRWRCEDIARPRHLDS